MSSLYLDILKDRLYVSGAGSWGRRSAQSTLWEILRSLTLLMAPILSFTAEEVWGFLPGEDKGESVHLAAFPEAPPGFPDGSLIEKYEFLLKVRGEINRRLEEARKNKILSTTQEARVELWISDDGLYRQIAPQADELKVLAQVPELSMVKQVSATAGEVLEAEEIPGLKVIVARAPGAKCVRCWFSYATVGADSRHPQLCARCSQVLEG
jgi:isoleucyl-tRNA synthetase